MTRARCRQYLVIKGLMDPPWLAAANDAVDAMQHTAAGPAGAFEAHPPLSSEEVQEQIESTSPNSPTTPAWWSSRRRTS